MPRSLACLLVALVLAGCGSGESEPGGDEGVSAAARIDRCADRLLDGSTDEAARAYTESTYCEPFEARGWIYDDGALNVAVLGGTESECASGTPEGGATGTSCAADDLRVDPLVLDCALLDHVRRDEAQAYVDDLRHKAGGRLECDDGTPLEALGDG